MPLLKLSSLAAATLVKQPKSGEDMSTFYVLIMDKYQSPNLKYWKTSSKSASSIEELRELERINCYSDPPVGTLSKKSFRATRGKDLKIPRCDDKTIVDDGAIYEFQDN
jgi:hypothetical protein